MNVLIVNPSVIPALLYGGTERVIWYLGKELVKLGHNVTYLVNKGSYCDFASVITFDKTKSLASQIPEDTDIVHFNFPINEIINKPYIITIHGNSSAGQDFDNNTVFVSKNHAERHNSLSYVYNGLDWDDYGNIDLKSPKEYFHFLGNAAWQVKNLKGALKLARLAQEKLYIIGGKRINFKMGFRFTTNFNTKFLGTIGGEKKNEFLRHSKGFLFPVLWHEPFGLAIIESMYFGCPVFGTPYGSLPELVKTETGLLSENINYIADALKSVGEFNRKYISDYAIEEYNSKKMAEKYIEKYEIVLSGKSLNDKKPIYLPDKNKTVFKFN